ncbi:MAG: LamG domain-containing protein [Roseibacillus sp.]|nr:LamG domain-containing protein [Roseibacillus sp.]
MRIPSSLLIATSAFSFVGAVAENVIENGDFEAVGGWSDGFNTFSLADDLWYTGPAPMGTGPTYGWGPSPGSPLTQDIDLTTRFTTAALDSGQLGFEFSAWLAGYYVASGTDYSLLTLQWKDGENGSLGTVSFDPADDSAGGNPAWWTGSASEAGTADPAVSHSLANWSRFSHSAHVPAGSRSVLLTWRGASSGSSNGNDSYLDGAALDIGTSGGPSALSGVLDPLARSVALSWTAADPDLGATGLTVLRDGTPIATLPLTASSYLDHPPLPLETPATINYTVRAYGGTEGESATTTATSVFWNPSGLHVDLVAYYRFEGNSRDLSSSPNTHDGREIGEPRFLGGGIYGHAVTFRDQASPTQLIQFGRHPDFDFGSDTNFTVSFWFRRLGEMEDNEALGGGGTDAALLTNKNWSRTNNTGWGIFSTSDGGVKWNISDGIAHKDSTIRNGFGTGGVADGRWHHLVITHNRSGSAKFYIDGSYTGASSISGLGSINSGLPLTLGADGRNRHPWGGDLDELALWRRELDSEEVAVVFENSKLGLSLTGTSIVDSDRDGLDDHWEMAFFDNLSQGADDDFESDGRSNLLEYSTGGNPTTTGDLAETRFTTENIGGEDYAVLHYTRPLLNGAIEYVPQAATDLTSWTGGEGKFLPHGEPTALPNGMREHHLRYHLPISRVGDHKFFRIRMSARYQAAHSLEIEPTVEFRSGQAIIRWITDAPAVTVLDYGTDGQTHSRYEHYELTTTHEVIIDGVEPGDILAYAAIHIADGAESRSNTFTTTRAWDYSPPAIPAHSLGATPAPWPGHASSILALPATPSRGYCLDYDCGSGELAYELAAQSELVIAAVAKTQADADAARAFLQARGVYGSRVTVFLEEDSIPFNPNTFNLIISADNIGGGASLTTLRPVLESYLVPARGILAGRVGSPGQDAEYTTHSKPEPPGYGSWTHQYGDPEGSAASGDTLSGATRISDFGLQWIGRPGPEIVIDRAVRTQAPLATKGRFYCQGMGRILCLDSHNGSVLWTRDVSDLNRLNLIRDSGNMCADDDGLWLAVRTECWKLAGDHGERTVYKVEPGPSPDFDYHWGYVGRSGDQLLGSATKYDAAYKSFWGQEYWFDAQSGTQTHMVVADNLFSLDKDTGILQWLYQEGLILNSTITVAEGKVFFLECRDATVAAGDTRRLPVNSWKSDVHLVCLDQATGQVLWDKTPSFTGGEPTVWLQYGNRRLILTGSNQSNDTVNIYTFDPANGDPIWDKSHGWRSSHHGGNHQHPVIMGDQFYLEPHRYSLTTGRITGSNIMPTRNGCSTFVGARSSLFYRGVESSGQYAGSIAMWDPRSRTTTAVSRVRPACWISWTPSQGMILVQEKGAGCSCGSWMETSFGLAPLAP